MSIDAQLIRRLDETEDMGIRVCTALWQEVVKLGFDDGAMKEISWKDAEFSLKHDPYSGEPSLEGVWHNAQGQQIGTILFHGRGEFFSEFDVVLPHPNDKRWFVEAVTAWGKGDTVKSEPRLLPMII